MRTAIFEVEPGPDDEVLDRARNEDLAGPGLGRDPCSDVNREAGNVIRQDLDLADVEPCTDLEPEILTSSRIAAAQRIARAGPSNVAKKPSPVTLTSAPPKRASWCRTTRLWSARSRCHRASPSSAASLRRPDDVGEHHGREHPAWIEHRSNARHEILDLGNDRVLIARPDEVVGAGQLDVLRTRDVLGEVPPVRDAEAHGRLAVDDQGRDPDRR